MRKFLLTLVVTLCALQLFAQRWNPARLVVPGRDTLRGEAILKYDTIRFRADANAKAVSYGTSDINVAYIDKDLYSSSEAIGLPPSEKAVLGGPFFMKVLLLGEVDLYYHINKSNRSSPTLFFIRKGDQPATQLIKTTTTEIINGQQYNRVNEAYRDQLKFLFSDCPSVVVDSRKDYYKEKPMLDLVSSYVSCKKSNPVYKTKIIVKKPQFTVMAGIDMATFTSTYTIGSAPSSTYRYLPASSSSSNPFFGVQMSISLSKNDRTSLISELMYNQLSATSHIFSPSYPAGFQDEDATTNIKRSYVRLNEGIRRTFKVGENMSANLHLGLSFSVAASSSYDVNLATLNKGTGVTSNSVISLAPNFSSNSEIGYFGGAGINYKKIGLLARFEQTLNISSNTDIVAKVQNIYFGLNYRIK